MGPDRLRGCFGAGGDRLPSARVLKLEKSVVGQLGSAYRRHGRGAASPSVTIGGRLVCAEPSPPPMIITERTAAPAIVPQTASTLQRCLIGCATSNRSTPQPTWTPPLMGSPRCSRRR